MRNHPLWKKFARMGREERAALRTMLVECDEAEIKLNERIHQLAQATGCPDDVAPSEWRWSMASSSTATIPEDMR